MIVKQQHSASGEATTQSIGFLYTMQQARFFLCIFQRRQFPILLELSIQQQK